MTYNEITKALECCGDEGAGCGKCPYNAENKCIDALLQDALDLINRKNAEIEKLETENLILSQKRINMFERLDIVNNARAEAYKECIEKIKDLRRNYTGYALDKKLDNLSKELVGTDFTQMFMGVKKLEPIPNNEKELVGDNK